ncbi:MAG: N-acetyl sugar amidotransferase [Deltaproteobacteria bacterium]|nr:N-acetyl sugar amidotransferase [Deltaproteobacteria bacterium]
MRYCLRCLYPENARPTILFDDHGVCSGCRAQETKKRLDWVDRERRLRDLFAEYKSKARARGNVYDCIIPVSGGKDSHYQVYLAKEVYGMNPLLVTYNHVFNTELGVRNLRNLVMRFNCDLIRVTSRPDAVRKIDRHMLQQIGDITWHYHTGIFTYPFQVAVEKGIPLILWGEHGNAEMTGMVNLEDTPEFTKWYRQEYVMRGYKVDQLVNDPASGVSEEDVAPFRFPSAERMEEIGVRGIYMGTYIEWDHLEIAKKMVEMCNFKMAEGPRERTFSQFHKIDDHANDVHDYLKYLKFGYGRGTDHATEEIRAGRMTRELGIEMAMKYDHVRPASLDFYLKYLGISEQDLLSWIEPLSDSDVWTLNGAGERVRKDVVANHIADPGVDSMRLPLLPEEQQTFGSENCHYYYSSAWTRSDRFVDRHLREAGVGDFLVL